MVLEDRLGYGDLLNKYLEYLLDAMPHSRQWKSTKINLETGNRQKFLSSLELAF